MEAVCPFIVKKHELIPNLSIDQVLRWKEWLQCECEFCKFYIEEQDQTVLTLCPNWLPDNPYPLNWKSLFVYEDDVGLVVSQTGCSRKAAIDALRQQSGDVVNAIMQLTD